MLNLNDPCWEVSEAAIVIVISNVISFMIGFVIAVFAKSISKIDDKSIAGQRDSTEAPGSTTSQAP